MSLIKWVTNPIHTVQQIRYFQGLEQKRRSEHNAKYRTMKSMWHTNGVALKCESCVVAMREINLEANPIDGLAEVETILKELGFNTAPELMGQLDKLVEETIEFYPNPVLQTVTALYPAMAERSNELSSRTTRDIELQLEGEAKKVLRELSNHVGDMVKVYQGMLKYLPALSKALKPSMMGGIFKALGWVANIAAKRGADRADNAIVSVAFEIGGPVIKSILEDLGTSLAANKTEEALVQFEKLIGSFEHACSTFAKMSEQKFDPILRKFMAYEKTHEDSVLAFLSEVAQSRSALKPVYVSLYGRLRD